MSCSEEHKFTLLRRAADNIKAAQADLKLGIMKSQMVSALGQASWTSVEENFPEGAQALSLMTREFN